MEVDPLEVHVHDELLEGVPLELLHAADFLLAVDLEVDEEAVLREEEVELLLVDREVDRVRVGLAVRERPAVEDGGHAPRGAVGPGAASIPVRPRLRAEGNRLLHD